MLKSLSILIASIISVTSFCQNKNSVFLKWKLQPKETLQYKTIMDETLPDSSQDVSFDFGNIFKSLDSNATNLKGLKNDLKSFEEENYLVTILTKNKKGSIDIQMLTEEKSSGNNKDTTEMNSNNLSKLFNLMSDNIVLRGSITETGQIESFYVQNDQKNLIAIFFQLPNKEISVGDSWELDTHLISMDQNFICDSSFKKNKVTLTGIKNTGNDKIAVIKYDVEEFIIGDFKNPFSVSENKKTMMKMIFWGESEFSIEKGRWVSYKGIMSMKSTGVMSANSTKKFQLISN